MTFLEKIGSIFSGLFNKASKAYNSLHKVEQQAAKDASGIIAVVNENIAKAPDELFTLLQSKFPTLSKEQLTKTLVSLANTINKLDSIMADDVLSALGSLQAYLSQYEGNEWIVVTKSVVALLANILAPENTVIQKIEMVLEFVYQTFVKGKV